MSFHLNGSKKLMFTLALQCKCHPKDKHILFLSRRRLKIFLANRKSKCHLLHQSCEEGKSAIFASSARHLAKTLWGKLGLSHATQLCESADPSPAAQGAKHSDLLPQDQRQFALGGSLLPWTKGFAEHCNYSLSPIVIFLDTISKSVCWVCPMSVLKNYAEPASVITAMQINLVWLLWLKANHFMYTCMLLII